MYRVRLFHKTVHEIAKSVKLDYKLGYKLFILTSEMDMHFPEKINDSVTYVFCSTSFKQPEYNSQSHIDPN